MTGVRSGSVLDGMADRVVRAAKNPRRACGALFTRLQAQRWLGMEPPEFKRLADDLLFTGQIEGWRYRQDLCLLYLLAREIPGPGVTLEIGSFKGLATTALAYGVRHGGHQRVHTVDPHTGDRQDLEARGATVLSSEAAFRRSLEIAGITDDVTAYVMKSDDLAPQWARRPIRVLFVDGWHGYDAVAADLANFVPHLTADGVVLIDDYLNYGEVKAAVDDAAALLPRHVVRAGRMRLAYPGSLPEPVRRFLRITWG